MNAMNRKIYEQLCSVPDDYDQNHLHRTIQLMDATHLHYTKDIIQRFTSIIPENLSETQKAALLYEVLTRRIHYSHNENSKSRFVFVSALLSQKAVCMGIAELYNILCNWIGISCKTIIGYAWNGFDENNGSLHAWNLVKLQTSTGKQWFHCDPTWDLDELNYTSKRFFLKNDNYMKMNRHIWLDNKYPKCPENYQGNIPLNEKGVEMTCHILEQVIASTLRTKE